jgi:hypothetical protein
MRQLFYLLIAAHLILAGSSNLSIAQSVSCPTVEIEVDNGPVCPGSPLTFKAKVAGLDSGIKLTYEWSLSVGKIESGQGTDTITVETAEIAGQSVRATVKVTGITVGCNNTAFQEAQVYTCCLLHNLFDQYGDIAFDDEKARLDNYAIQLQNEPEALGYIIAYGGRTTFDGQARERADRARDYLTSNYSFTNGRIVTIDGGYREDMTVELWITPQGGPAPTASPTIRPEDVRVIEKPTPRKTGRKR